MPSHGHSACERHGTTAPRGLRWADRAQPPTWGESTPRSATPERMVADTAVDAARAGGGAGLVIGACVAVWVGARVAFGVADGADVMPIQSAVQWSNEAPPVGTGRTEWGRTVGPIALVLALHLAAAAAVGAAVWATLARTVPDRLRIMLALVIAAAECALWQAAGAHVGPWLSAVVWYHLATATLSVVAALGHLAEPSEWADACARAASARPHREAEMTAARSLKQSHRVSTHGGAS